MSEENQKEKEENVVKKVVKVSDLINEQPQPLAGGKELSAQIQAQIQNNQELYTTLSRSLLELHNDVRNLRNKGEGMERVIFSIQQVVNKSILDIDQRVSALEKGLAELTALWNSAVNKSQEEVEEEMSTAEQLSLL